MLPTNRNLSPHHDESAGLGVSLRFILIISLLVAPSGSTAQGVIRVSGRSTCETCRITVTPLVAIGGIQDSLGIDHRSRVILTSGNQLIVSGSAGKGRLGLFDLRGNLVKIVGKGGSGPGEYIAIGAVAAGSADTIHVFDIALRRWTVLDPLQRPVASVKTDLIVQEARSLPDGKMVVVGNSGTPDAFGFPVHILSRQGHILRSIAGTPGPQHDGNESDRARTIAVANSGRVWVARRNAYVLELWDTAGRKYLTVERDVGWFPPRSGDPYVFPYEERPKPSLSSFWEDSAGRLWVLITVADSKWKRENIVGEKRVAVSDLQNWFDYILEVIDLRQGKVLASARYDSLLRVAQSPGVVYALEEDAAGAVVMRVGRPELKPR